MVTLINNTRKMRVYNLDHTSFRTKQWGARRTVITVFEEHRDGRRLPRQLHRSLPGSLTLRAGERREGLPAQIQAVPSIRKALKQGILSVVKEKAPAPAPVAATKKNRRNKD